MHTNLRIVFLYLGASLLVDHWPARALALELFVEADVAVQAGDANQQLRAQFEPLVKVELSFAIRVCKLEGDERKKVIDAGEKWFVQYLKSMQEGQQGRQRGPLQVVIRGHGGDSNDFHCSVAESIAVAVQSVLTPEQAAHYMQECKKRESFRCEAIAAMLVARMDEKLALSAEQREKLAESFVGGWSDQWAPQPELFMYNQDIWPPVPDKLVSPHLTPAQWEIWTRLNKAAQRIHFGGMFPNQEQVIDDVELKQPAAEPPAQPAEGIFVPNLVR